MVSHMLNLKKSLSVHMYWPEQAWGHSEKYNSPPERGNEYLLWIIFKYFIQNLPKYCIWTVPEVDKYITY